MLVLESGRFAVAWGEMAAFSGVQVEVLAAPERGPVDPAAVEARLRADSRATEHLGRLRGARRHRHVRAQRHRRDPPGDGRRRPPRAADGRLHRLAGLRGVRDGRVGGRPDRRRIAEGADGPARPRVRVGRPARAGRPRVGRAPLGLLGLDRPRPGRSALPALLRHATHLPPVRAAGGAGHARGGGPGGGLGTPRGPGHRHPRRRRRPGARPVGWSSTSPTRRPAPTRSPPSWPARSTPTGCGPRASSRPG